VTVKGFEESCISSAVTGTDDDLLWNDNEEDGRDVRFRSDCEEGDGTDCEDGDIDTDR